MSVRNMYLDPNYYYLNRNFDQESGLAAFLHYLVKNTQTNFSNNRKQQL